MSEKEKQIAEKVGKITELMTDAQKDKMLAFMDGMSANMKIVQQDQQSA